MLRHLRVPFALAHNHGCTAVVHRGDMLINKHPRAPRAKCIEPTAVSASLCRHDECYERGVYGLPPQLRPRTAEGTEVPSAVFLLTASPL